MAEAPKTPPPANESEGQRVSRGLAEAAAEAEARQADEGPAGGRYKVGDQMVDAEGKPVSEKKPD